MTEAIIEKFSKKRGRPAWAGKPMMASLYHEHGERSLNNMIAAGEASHALDFPKHDAALNWLFETTPAGRFKRGTLIAEIGRLQNPDLIKSVAEYICKEKPKVKDGVIMVRSYRRSLQGYKPSPPSAITLTNEILQAINNYVMRYPETTMLQITAALENARDAIETPAEEI
jgi:hypothetical protein